MPSSTPLAESNIATTPPDDAPTAMTLDETRKSYLFSLAREARLARREAPHALSARTTGTSEIKIAIGSDGTPQSPQLLTSSGYAELDRAALDIIDTALRRTPVPDRLREEGLELVLPIRFEAGD